MHVSSPSPPPAFRYLTQEEAKGLKKDSWECIVCYDTDITRPIITHCKPSQHSVHAACALPYSKECGLCPVCRQEVDWRQLASIIDRIVYSGAVREVVASISCMAEQANSWSRGAIACGALGIITGLVVMSFPLFAIGIGTSVWGFSLGKKELAEASFSLGIDLAEKEKEKEIFEATGAPQSQIDVAQIEIERLQNEINTKQRRRCILTAMQVVEVFLGIPAYYYSVLERGGAR